MLIFSDNFKEKLLNDNYRYYFQMNFLCFVLGIVSFFMCGMNILTDKFTLMIATGIFGVICSVNFAIMMKLRHCTLFNSVSMTLSILVLFTYFLVTGGTEGFSPHWILLLPSCGMFLFGKKMGFGVSLAMFFITAFLLWLPYGKSLLLYTYTNEFCMRFPVVYFAFFVVGFLLETVRSITYDTLVATREKMAKAAETDLLTDLNNRLGFDHAISAKFDTKLLPPNGCVLMMDIDHFKKFNDDYDHLNGDIALRETASAIKSQMKDEDILCRWGGEEFLAYLPDCTERDISERCENILNAVRNHRFNGPNGEKLSLTISIGAYPIKGGVPVSQSTIIKKADAALYRAKDDGRDCFRIY